jgi:RNA polymerase sigma factor (sigma-70 family)
MGQDDGGRNEDYDGDRGLVAAAAAGDSQAWGLLVDRYAGLVWSVCRRFRLSDSDAEDVSQTVWLRLVERLDTLREPNALAGWLATSTRNECIALWRAKKRQVPVAPDAALNLWDDPDARPLDHDLLSEERGRALRASLRSLPDACRQLLTLLFADPPTSYEEISVRMGVSKGFIGPTRLRCLKKLRACPHLVAYVGLEQELAGTGARGTVGYAELAD